MTDPRCTYEMTQASTVDLLEQAARGRNRRELRAAADAVTPPTAVMIRFATFDDELWLLELADLDSARPLTLPVLVAELEGSVLAAFSISEGRAIADPFHPTVALVELLRTRARQLGGEEPEAGLITALRHPRRTLRAIRLAVAAVA